MYHIPNDKRAYKSAELIFNGLLRCIPKKPFDLISISDLQKESGVARSTFYRLFDNMSDILYWKCSTCFKEVLNTDTSEIFFNELDFTVNYFSYWLKHSEILELLIDINRQDIIYACHMENAEILQQNYGEPKGLNIRYGNYFMAVRTSLTIGILTAWLKGGKAETVEEIVQIIKEQLILLAENTTQQS